MRKQITSNKNKNKNKKQQQQAKGNTSTRGEMKHAMSKGVVQLK